MSVKALPVGTADRLTGTHNRYNLFDDNSYVHTEDADDLYGTVERLNGLLDYLVI